MLLRLFQVLLELDVVAEEAVDLGRVVLVVQADHRQHRHFKWAIIVKILMVAALFLLSELLQLVLKLLLTFHLLHQKVEVFVDVLLRYRLVKVVLSQVLAHLLRLSGMHLLDSVLDVRKQTRLRLLPSLHHALGLASNRVAGLSHEYRQAQLCLGVLKFDLLHAILDRISFARPPEVGLEVSVREVVRELKRPLLSAIELVKGRVVLAVAEVVPEEACGMVGRASVMLDEVNRHLRCRVAHLLELVDRLLAFGHLPGVRHARQSLDSDVLLLRDGFVVEALELNIYFVWLLPACNRLSFASLADLQNASCGLH